MALHIELEREDDGRWIAEVVELPGVMVYAASQKDAVLKAQLLALQVIADKLEHGESAPSEELFTVSHAA